MGTNRLHVLTTKTSCTLYWPLRWHKQLPTSGISQSCGARLAKQKKRRKQGERKQDLEIMTVLELLMLDPSSAPTVLSEEEKEGMIVILFFCKQRYMYL